MARGTRPVRIAAFSGHSADRITGLAECAQWGGNGSDDFLPADFIVGDLLAEATLAYLTKREVGGTGSGGFLPGFLKQLQTCFDVIVDKGIKIVTNAGGANPAGLAKSVSELAVKMMGDKGKKVKVAWVEGDNVLAELENWKAQGIELRNMVRSISSPPF